MIQTKLFPDLYLQLKIFSDALAKSFFPCFSTILILTSFNIFLILILPFSKHTQTLAINFIT